MMGANDHIDLALYEAIQDLVDEALIEEGSKEYGVAQQVIHQGYDSLTPKQRIVYDKGIAPALDKRAKEIEINRILMSNPD